MTTTNVPNILHPTDMVLASKLNENFAALDGVIIDNYSELTTLQGTVTGIQSAMANVPTGTVIWFAAENAPDGYYICNGSWVSTSDAAGLYAVIGQTFGWDEDHSEFKLPNLIGNYPRIQGSATVGTEIDAGLPNITGKLYGFRTYTSAPGHEGALSYSSSETSKQAETKSSDGFNCVLFDASDANTIYGSSTTVQPPSLTLLPCIKK